MKGFNIQIENCEKGLCMSDVDLVCLEKIDHLDKVIASSIVRVRVMEENEIFRLIIRFDWKDDNVIDVSDFIFIPETNTLFFRSTNQWGAVDVREKIIVRQESSLWSPIIERRNDFLLITDDLSAEATKLNGESIDKVPIDPPTESKEFDDRIEFNSPVFGQQTLQLKL